MGPPRIKWAFNDEPLSDEEKQKLKETVEDESLPEDVRLTAKHELKVGRRRSLIGRCDKTYHNEETGRPVRCNEIWTPDGIWPIWVPIEKKWMCPTCKQVYRPVPFEAPTRGMSDMDPESLMDPDSGMVTPAVAMPGFEDFAELGADDDRVPGISPKIAKYDFSMTKEPGAGPKREKTQKAKDIQDVSKALEFDFDFGADDDDDDDVDLDLDELFGEGADPTIKVISKFMNLLDDD